MIGVAGALMLVISVAAVVRVATSEDHDLSSLVKWGVGCAGFALFATLWYRARVEAIAKLEAAVASGASLYRCHVTAVCVRAIPLGHEVDLVAIDTARETSTHLAFGFWTAASANKLLAVLKPHMVAGTPPAFRIKMRAPVRR